MTKRITKRDIAELHSEILSRHGFNVSVETVTTLLALEQVLTALAAIGMCLDAAIDILLNTTHRPGEEVCDHVLRMAYDDNVVTPAPAPRPRKRPPT
jgi:hypothetical protein